MAFYTFYQNNSGGIFFSPAQYVIIEADSFEDANSIALDHGLYFNGVEDKHDCPCCGDRWHPFYYETSRTDVPMIYGSTDYVSERSTLVVYASGVTKLFNSDGLL